MNDRETPNGSNDPDDDLDRALASGFDPLIAELIARVDPPDPQRRDAAIAAALQVFDERSAAQRPLRDTSRRLVAIAAAILAIGAGAAIVVNVGQRGTGEESATAVRQAAAEPLLGVDTTAPGFVPSVGADAATTVDEPELDTADDAPVTTTTTRPAGSVGSPQDPAPAPAPPPLSLPPFPPIPAPPVGGADAAIGEPSPETTAPGLARLNSPGELAAFARNAIDAGLRRAAPGCAPAGAVGVGDAIYGASPVSVIVVDTRTVQAIDPGTCAVVASATLD